MKEKRNKKSKHSKHKLNKDSRQKKRKHRSVSYIFLITHNIKIDEKIAVDSNIITYYMIYVCMTNIIYTFIARKLLKFAFTHFSLQARVLPTPMNG